MAVFNCEKHGHTLGTFACKHLNQNINRSALNYPPVHLVNFKFSDGGLWPIFFCSYCNNINHFQKEVAIKSDDEMERIWELLEIKVVCSDCLGELKKKITNI